MIRLLSAAAVTALSFAIPALAQADEDELVRLPGQGELIEPALREKAKADRLKPGAGLFITFDEDENGRISPAETAAGIPVAFASADENADGYLTALEQQDWAASLPTRDDSLANPFRFDPNLDRRVDIDEFTLVISNLADDYADEETGEIIVEDLKAPKTKRERAGDPLEEAVRQRRRDRDTRQNQTVQ